MLKLLCTILLGCFCIYGFDELGIISVEDFDETAYQTEAQDVGNHEKIENLKFTDRIAAKNK